MTHTDTGHRFYPLMGAVMLILVILGFGSAALARGQNPLDLPLLYHLHGVIFIAWFVLFIVQASLIGRDHRSLHIALGKFSLVVVALMLVTGVLMAGDALERGVSAIPGVSIEQFVAFPISDLTGLVVFYTLAIARRADAVFHKRAMLLALVAIMDPATARCGIVWGFPPFPLVASLALIGALIWHDRRVLGRVHGLTWFGLFWIFLRPAFVFGFAATDLWIDLIAGLRS